MDETVRNKYVIAKQVERTSPYISHSSTCLANQQRSRGFVPGIKLQFPETIEVASRNEAQVKCRRSNPPDAVRQLRKPEEELNVQIVIGRKGREARTHKALTEFVDAGNVQSIPV